MRTFQTFGIVLASLTASLPGNSIASNLCEQVKRCENGCYTSVSRGTDLPASLPMGDNIQCPLVNSEGSDYVAFSIPLNSPPVPTAMDCVAYNGTGSCEGWPEGESITYTWSASGGVSIGAGTAANPIRNFTCTRGTTGTITMTALSPQGAASSVTTSVSCP